MNHNVALVDFTVIFLEKSWSWLQDGEIKKLTLTPEFNKESQLTFYHNLPNRKDYWIKGMSYEKEPIGVMGIKNISATDGEYWGYIGEKDFWGKGIGHFMLDEAVKKGKALNLKFLYLNVADYNERAIRLYKKFGFELKSSKDGIEKYLLEL